MLKARKTSSKSSKVDRLSLLPDELLAQILSLIPTKSAVGTSILSKRWRYSWTLVHSLDFHYTGDINDCDSFLSFVDRVLNLCKTSQLKLFRLEFSNSVDENQHVGNWINEAVCLNVCEVDLIITPFELPLSLFTCKTLTKLSLYGWGMEGFIGPSLDVITLPLLKTLHITLPISIPGFVSVSAFKLIHACPMLEDLSLETACCYEQEDYHFNIPTLKRLKLNMIGYSSLNKLILNLPNLEYLFVVGLLSSLVVIEYVSSLVEANVSLSYIEENLSHLSAKLLKGISRAKSISWSSPRLDVLLKSPLPKFPNLKHLKLKGSLRSRSLKLFRHLESSSDLEHLSFQEPKKSCWIKPGSVPTWMLTNIKTMEIRRCKGRECDMQFIEYVLGNSEVLKELTVRCKKSLGKQGEKRLCARLLKCQRANRFCQIRFVGKWLPDIF